MWNLVSVRLTSMLEDAFRIWYSIIPQEDIENFQS